MGAKLLWTAITVFLIAPIIVIPAASIVAGVLAIIGCVLMWLDK